jgi:hypothetical protein
MKYAHLFLLSLVPGSCSSSIEDNLNNIQNVPVKKLSLEGMPSDMLRSIHDWLGIRDQNSMRLYNEDTLKALPLKKQVEQVFNISGLENVPDNAPELAGVMRLFWTSHDPFLFFAALMEDVVGGKKPYEVLFRPLMLHLIRTFRALADGKKQEYIQYVHNRFQITVEEYFARICVRKGHFDLVFDIATDDPQVLTELDYVENWDLLIEAFRHNNGFAYQYLEHLKYIIRTDYNTVSLGKTVGRFIAECIINNLPQSYYEQIFSIDHWYLTCMINHLILSTNIPESEYGRIHTEIFIHLDKYSRGLLQKFPIFVTAKMITDIRFGTVDLEEFKSLESKCMQSLTMQVLIAKAAVLANKQELFNYIYTNYEVIMSEFVIFRKLINVNDLQTKNFKIIFDTIQADSNLARNADLNISYFVMNFYAIHHMKFEENSVIFEFIASEKSLEFEFPKVIRIEKELNDAKGFIEYIFWNMTVFNESSVNALIPDLIEYNNRLITSKFEINLMASYEFMELLSNLPNILELIRGNGIKFYFSSDIETMEKYFNLPNFELTSQIVNWSDKHFSKLNELKTRDHLGKMEIIQEKRVGESFLQLEPPSTGNGINLLQHENAELKYFEWRLVFAYWLKTNLGHGMSQIRTAEFIDMLKLDFPDETKDLFP